MRIALLSALADNPDHQGERLAFRRFVGRSVLAHQIDIMLALGCERIICLSTGLSPELLTCQHRAERGGARFQAIGTSRHLASMVTAQDALFVLADGLLPEAGECVEALALRPAILTFPADAAVAKGFERIDANLAWAGGMHLLGSTAERLNDLPEDSDAISALLRVALQGGTSKSAVPLGLMEEGLWSLKDSYTARTEREKTWVSRHIALSSFVAPGAAIADRIGARLARDFVGGKLQRLPVFATVIGGVVAGAAAIFGYPIASLCCAIFMVFSERVSGIFERLNLAGRPARTKKPFGDWLRLGCDAMILALLVNVMPREIEWLRMFLPAMLIGLLHLGERRGAARWRPLYADRIVLLAVLTPMVWLGFPSEAVAAVCISVLASIFVEQSQSDTNP